MKWFVYDNETYYPDATLVEADTPEAAIEIYKAGTRSLGYHGLAVFPLGALAVWTCGYETGDAIDEVLEDV